MSEVVSPASLEAEVPEWFLLAPPGTELAPLHWAWDWKAWEQMMQTQPVVADSLCELGWGWDAASPLE